MACFKIFLVFFVGVLWRCVIFALPLIVGPDEDRTKLCKERRCIPKCCEEDKVLDFDGMGCVDSDEKHPLSEFDNKLVYETSANGTVNELVYKKLGDISYYLVPGKIHELTTIENKTSFIPEDENLKICITETDYVYLKNEELWLKTQDFCLDYVNSSNKFHLKLLALMDDPGDSNDDGDSNNNSSNSDNNNTERSAEDSKIAYYSFIISSVFLVIVLLVYIALPELRSLGGMILMAYVTSLLCFFIVLAVMNGHPVEKNNKILCIYRTTFLYFFLMSTCCWMNVMSLDIWWTFRGYAKARPIHRRGVHFKFCMYCLYGWGLPGIMAIGFVVVNEADLSQYPWIITPGITGGQCFLYGKPKNLYMYTPMAILILMNVLFYLMTVHNIMRLRKGNAILNSNSTAAVNPTAHRIENLKNRFAIYLKMFVIMGINWLFEILSVLFKDYQNSVWKYTDLYNMFIGVAIFFMFVFKKKIYIKLKLRFSAFVGYRSKRPLPTQTKSSISETNV